MVPHSMQHHPPALHPCREAGTPAAEIRVGPRPCTPEFLQRSPLIPQKVWRRLRQAVWALACNLLTQSASLGAKFLFDTLCLDC